MNVLLSQSPIIRTPPISGFGIGKNGRDLWIWDLGIANTIDKCKSPIEFQRHRSKVMVIEPDFLMPWGLAIGQH